MIIKNIYEKVAGLPDTLLNYLPYPILVFLPRIMPWFPNQLQATDAIRLGWQSRAEMRRLLKKTSPGSSLCEQNTTKIFSECRKSHSSKAKTKRALYLHPSPPPPSPNRIMSVVLAK